MADVTKVKASDGTVYDINDVNDYTKDETDALLAGKADVGDSYTKAEDDALLADKANSSDVASELALKANVVDVYSKTEANNLLAGKADTGVSYTKAEEDALLADKANGADVYTITQTDALLADKASIDDSSTTATMATWSADKLNVEFQGKADVGDSYTKAEVDALIGGIKMIPLLDFTNPLHVFIANDLTYTATEDGYIFGCFRSSTTMSNNKGLHINGVLVLAFENFNQNNPSPYIRVKAGDVITVDGDAFNASWNKLGVYKERS